MSYQVPPPRIFPLNPPRHPSHPQANVEYTSDDEWEQDDFADEEDSVSYWIRFAHEFACAFFFSIYEIGLCIGHLSCAIVSRPYIIVRSICALAVGILASIIHISLLWMLFCLAVHVTDWYQNRRGSLAANVFCVMNPISLCYREIWGSWMPAVTLLADMLHPFSIVWTAVLPMTLDHGMLEATHAS